MKKQQAFHKMNTKEQIINISLTATSDYAYHLIGNIFTIEIHSVYNKTINLLINNEIFALLPNNGYLSPVSLITNLTPLEFQQLNFQQKQIYQIQLNNQNCVIFPSKLTALSNPNFQLLQYYAEIAEKVLRQSTTTGLCLLLKNQSEDLILSATNRYLSQFQAYYQAQDIKSAFNILLKLIGLGIGLTPSGDDFLCGFISVFHRLNLTGTEFFQVLQEQIRLHLRNTNPISARFLGCALENHFSKSIIEFFQLSPTTPPDIPQLVRIFENIGHSSGMDTLFGIYYACRLFLETKEQIL